MHNPIIRRGVTAVLALLLALPVLCAAAMAADPFIELVATDVTLDETEFTYTGEEIRPNVTVRVNGQLLTLDKDYYLEYANNIEVGEAKVIVTGIATSGYAGTVEHPFFIRETQEPQKPEFTLVTLTEEMVSMEGSEFPYTGEAIEPKITVTVEGKTLQQDRDFVVEYVNNLIPGTGTAIIRGIATASETLGYTGEVRKNFTITEVKEPETSAPTDPSQPTEPSQPTTPSEPSEPTQPSTPTEPTEPEKPTYKITKGNKSDWTQGSKSGLSFTADGPFADFKGVSVDGKKLDKTHYDAKDGTVVLLKSSFLQELKTGSHTITVHFAEADAEGTFTISAAGENPKTGDIIVTWLMVMTVSGAALLMLKKKTA